METTEPALVDYIMNTARGSKLSDYETRVKLWKDITSDQGWYCQVNFTNLHPYPDVQKDFAYCNSTWDGVTCWPTTPASHLSIMPCPETFAGFGVRKGGNATRQCLANGTWQSKSDYSACTHLDMPAADEGENAVNYVTQMIYTFGYSTSIAVMLAALIIFITFRRTLHCLRNTIHCHLILSILLRNVLWLLLSSVLPTLVNNEQSPRALEVICKGLVTTFIYCRIASFFWMLAEGLHLHVLVISALNASKYKLWHCLIIGWGAPWFIVFAWGFAKAHAEDVMCWLPRYKSRLDYIYMGPVITILIVNAIILIRIIWVLVTKLRTSHTVPSNEYRKAARSTIILFPLLGLTNGFFMFLPADNDTLQSAFIYTNAILQSMQGIAVSVFYCFLHHEVRQVIRLRCTRWRQRQSLPQLSTRASSAVNVLEAAHLDVKLAFPLISAATTMVAAGTGIATAAGRRQTLQFHHQKQLQPHYQHYSSHHLRRTADVCGCEPRTTTAYPTVIVHEVE